MSIPGKLAAMGMTLEDVRQTLTQATVNSPKGSLDGPERSLTVQANDQLTTPDPYGNLVIAYRIGAPVRVRDIGTASRGPQNRELISWQNGHKGVILVVFKQPGANVIATVERIKAMLPRLEASIPPTIHVFSIVDRTQTIRASVSDVEFTLMLLHRPRRDGDLPVPAQPVGHHHPERHGAAGPGRHVRGDVPARLQPRQSVADGHDDRGRLRRRRRHRHAGKTSTGISRTASARWKRR